MQIVVMAGGRGSRLGSLSASVPKILQPVLGRPFLDHLVDSLAVHGFSRFHFVLGHLAPLVIDHLSAGWPGLEYTTSVEPVPRGTAGALADAADRLDEVFMLVMGDTYLPIEYLDLVSASRDGLACTMAVTSASGEVTPNVLVEPPWVTRYHKAGVGTRQAWVDTGAVVLRKKVLDLIPPGPEPVDLSVLFQALIADRTLQAWPTDSEFFDIGTSDRLARFADHVAGRKGAARPR
jgi:NDP-sugar pyrophosphorylase family protein